MAILKIRVGTKIAYTGFFIVESGTNYNAIRGRNCLHHNYAIQSSLHQVLIVWNGDTYEMVQANEKVCLITYPYFVFIRDSLKSVPTIKIDVALQLESQTHQEIEDSSEILIEEVEDVLEVEDIQSKYEYVQLALSYDHPLALVGL